MLAPSRRPSSPGRAGSRDQWLKGEEGHPSTGCAGAQRTASQTPGLVQVFFFLTALLFADRAPAHSIGFHQTQVQLREKPTGSLAVVHIPYIHCPWKAVQNLFLPVVRQAATRPHWWTVSIPSPFTGLPIFRSASWAWTPAGSRSIHKPLPELYASLPWPGWEIALSVESSAW